MSQGFDRLFDAISSKTLSWWVYLVLRLMVAGAGLMVLLGLFASEIAMPELMYDGPEGVPPVSERIKSSIPPLAAAILFLLPYRLTYKRPWFEVRLGCFSLISLWCLYIGGRSVLDYLGGGKHWMIVPAGAGIAVVGICLPMSLWLGRKVQRDRIHTDD